MNDNTRDILIRQMGTLQVANAELAGENIRLSNENARLQQRIAELESAAEQPSLPMTINSEQANGRAH